MKLKIIVLANIITIIVCLILTGLYFVSNPGGFYVKSNGFLPSFEYSSVMGNYKNTSSFIYMEPVTINTTDRSINVCVNSYDDKDKDLVMGNYQNLETIQFSVEELSNMVSINIDDYIYHINDGAVTNIDDNGSIRSEYIYYAGDSIEELANTTFYYSPSNPTELYTSQYIESFENLELSYYVRGFFTISHDNGINIQMTENIDDANLEEHIQISLPFQIEETCTNVEPNSTYIIDSTGGHYE